LATLSAALATLLLSGAAVWADSIPWGYTAADTEIFNNNTPAMSSSIVMKGSSGVASGNSGIIIYNLTTTSAAGDSAPDSFANVPFDLAVTLTDIKATGSSAGTKTTNGVVKFSGLFNADNVTKSSLLPGATTWTSPIVGEVTLGANDVGWQKYTVTLNSFTPPGQPGGAPGSIQAIVTITSVPNPDEGGGIDPPPPPAAPEPASLVLAGLGLPLFILLRRRMKKAPLETVS
jgi:hypothetical protein